MHSMMWCHPQLGVAVVVAVVAANMVALLHTVDGAQKEQSYDDLCDLIVKHAQSAARVHNVRASSACCRCMHSIFKLSGGTIMSDARLLHARTCCPPSVPCMRTMHACCARSHAGSVAKSFCILSGAQPHFSVDQWPRHNARA
jgi:hypothetical protein